MDSSDNKDKRTSKAQPTQAGEDNGIDRVARLNSREPDNSSRQEKETNKQRRSDRLYLRARVTVDNCAQTPSDPEWLSSRSRQEGIRLKERSSSVERISKQLK